METISGYAPVVELTRGSIIECVHFGALAMVDSDGKLMFSLGDPGLVTFPRSSMKPFQTLPFIELGGQQAFGLTEEEISIMCASHHGTDEHVRVLKSIHQKADLNEGMLQCGVHWPGDKATAAEMRERGEAPTPFRHNCSGKHSGMLAHARLRALPLETYLDLAHPVQETIRAIVAEMCDVSPESLIPGTDGCSAPVYAMPLDRFAFAVARLCDPAEFAEPRQSACRKITQAMTAYPVMVSGPTGFDTALMRVMEGKAVVKGGAEGYQMIGLLPDALHPGSKGMGI
ncbi:MAG: asparaginase, partial [Anaerolineaceae bacterium]